MATSLPAQDKPADAKALEGLWSGSWGGGGGDGVVFQPVLAEVVIEQGQAELWGFKGLDRFKGRVEIDPAARRIRVTSQPDQDETRKTVQFAYQLDGDKLTLVDSNQLEVQLGRVPTDSKPLPNVQLEFVQARGINQAGQLLVTEFSRLRSGLGGRELYQEQPRSLQIKQASILSVQAVGMQEITIAEARKLLDEPKAVAIAFLSDEQLATYQSHQLWKNLGSPRADSDAARSTMLQVLRPGTLVFILPAVEKVPRP